MISCKATLVEFMKVIHAKYEKTYEAIGNEMEEALRYWLAPHTQENYC
ncbi:MAG: hypothetical protein QXE38_03720 [Candidatus Methanomethylicia archaeon]